MSGAKQNSLLRRWDGPLTEDLVLRPGDFGLGNVPARLKPNGTATTVCGFCSTGCGLKVHLRNGEAINLSAEDQYPVNLGMACPKGWEALTPLSAPDRATRPLRRNGNRDFQPVTWDEALRIFVEQFKSIQQRHGPDSLAWLGSGQITTEELAFLGALAKFGMGIRHGDGNTRQCMATAATAYKESFGFDAPPFTYADFEESDVLVFVGSNLCIAHPILWQRVMRNQKRPAIIVLDPRKTETAMAATQHLALKPKSDLTLLYGVANLLATNGWIDRKFIEHSTTGYHDFEDFVRTFTPDRVATETGLTVGEIFRFAERIHHGKNVSFWWTMGVNQGHEATRTAQAIINLALMTGNVGRPGTGANSITGQCNAMGSRIFSNTTNLLGGRDFANAAHRRSVASTLGIEVSCLPQEDCRAYDQIVQGIADGTIKGLWVIGTNSAHSWIGQREFNTVLDKLEFLVVQDMFATTETARRAHLILPAAGWGEKEGTFINSERRIGHVKNISRTPGEALADFHIFQLVARAWGCRAMFDRWNSPEAAFQIIKDLSRGQPCDISGIADYRQLDEAGGIQWPWPAAMPEEPPLETGENNGTANGGHLPGKERRLFADGKFFHSDGRARFIFEESRPLPESTDDEYPFLLLTGRGTSAQWHTGTRTEKSDVLRKLRPGKIYAEINPHDAKRLEIRANHPVRISSRRGWLTAAAFVTATIQPGQVFIPMHYAETNQLTLPAFDPYSRQPAYKACAVKIEPA
jgi:assimilatory nitrate reductase catalytic subunit